MAGDCYVSVVFGVQETPEMRERRRFTVQRPKVVCSANDRHPLPASLPRDDARCALCGSPVAIAEVDVVGLSHPATFYTAPPAEDVEDWIHTSSADDIVLGQTVLGITPHRSLSFPTPPISDELRRRVDAFLRTNGLDPDAYDVHKPRLYLVLSFD